MPAVRPPPRVQAHQTDLTPSITQQHGQHPPSSKALPHSVVSQPFRGYKDRHQQVLSSPNTQRVPARCTCEVSLPPTGHTIATSHFGFLSLTIGAWHDRTPTLQHFNSAIPGSASVEYVPGVMNLSPGSHIISSTSRGKLPLKERAAAVKNQTRQLNRDYEPNHHICCCCRQCCSYSAFTLNSHPTLLIRPFETGHEIILS